MKFKSWLLTNENLAGPGGGPSMRPGEVEAFYKDVAKNGAGAFPTVGGDPPKPAPTPTERYADPKKFKPNWLGRR